MRLHGYWRSTSSWRVRIVLGLKGLAWENVGVNLLAGEHRAPTHLAKNPLGQVPVLELDDGRRIGQSMAILEWLEETHPTPALLPRDAYDRARVRQLAEIVNSGTQPLQNLAVLKALEASSPGADAKAWAATWIRKGLEAYAALARETAGTFSFGNAVTLADALLVPQLFNARRFGAELNDLDLLLRVEAACQKVDAFERAHPDRQPDAP